MREWKGQRSTAIRRNLGRMSPPRVEGAISARSREASDQVSRRVETLEYTLLRQRAPWG